MIAIILSWTILFFVFLSFGEMAVWAWNKIVKQADSYSITDKFWMGICFLGTLLLYISIFFALNIWVLIAILIISMAYWVVSRARLKMYWSNMKRGVKEMSLLEKATLVFVFATVLIYSLSTPLIYDEGLYHLQSMQWTEKYGTVLGLGNLHGRLAFNSSFLLLSTVFNYHPAYFETFFTINSLALGLFSCWLIGLIFKTGDSVRSIAALALVLLASLFSLGTNVSSTSTDILPNLFILYILISWALDKDFVKNKPLVLAAISIFCITLKLSSAVIVVAALICVISLFRGGNKKTAYMVLALGVVVAVPWLVRFVLLSGYLVYPFPAIDVFSVDWKIPLALVTEEKDLAYAWARVPNMDAKEVLAMGFMEWIPLWIEKLSSYNLLIYTLAIISPLFVLIWRAKGITPWLIAYLGVLFGIFTAPDFRFGFGFLMAAVVIPFLLPSNQKKYSALQLFTKGAIAVGLVGLIYIASAQLKTYQTLSSDSAISLLYKPQSVNLLQGEPNFEEYKLNNTTIFVPQGNNQCFDQSIPCMPYHSSNMEMRGDGIQDGFRIKQ